MKTQIRIRAFTLIEISVVLFLMAIVSAVVTASLARTYGVAQMRDVVDALEHADRLARWEASDSGRVVLLRVDASEGVVERAFEDDADRDDGAIQEPYRLPERFEIERLWVQGSRAPSDAATIRCTPRGRTPTYGLSVTGPQMQRVAIVVAGATGQLVEVEDANEAEELFERLSRRDAD